MRKMFFISLALLFCLAFTGAAAQAADIALTPVGQSPDAMMIKVLLKKMKVKADLKKLMSENDVNGYKAIIVVAGGSAKGLGAAGIDKNQELDRVKKLFAAAKAKGVKILAMQVAGRNRRGKLSDLFIARWCPSRTP